MIIFFTDRRSFLRFVWRLFLADYISPELPSNPTPLGDIGLRDSSHSFARPDIRCYSAPPDLCPYSEMTPQPQGSKLRN